MQQEADDSFFNTEHDAEILQTKQMIRQSNTSQIPGQRHRPADQTNSLQYNPQRILHMQSQTSIPMVYAPLLLDDEDDEEDGVGETRTGIILGAKWATAFIQNAL